MEQYWIIAFLITWFINFILFGMQRASLMISRQSGIEWRGGGELLLPSWYPLTWAVIVIKWGIIVASAIFISWKLAIAFAIGGYIASIIMPIPYSLYSGIFKRRVNEIKKLDPEIGEQLQLMLDNSPN